MAYIHLANQKNYVICEIKGCYFAVSQLCTMAQLVDYASNSTTGWRSRSRPGAHQEALQVRAFIVDKCPPVLQFSTDDIFLENVYIIFQHLEAIEHKNVYIVQLYTMDIYIHCLLLLR